jgi:ribonuclease D
MNGNHQSFSHIQFPGQIHSINTNQELEKVLPEILAQTELGFDTETRASFHKGEVYQVALVQLATESNAYLIRIQNLKDFTPLKHIFENTKIKKVGAALRDDLKALQKMFPFTPQNFLELQELSTQKGLANKGLKGMTEEVLGKTLSKRAKISNWERFPLSHEQIIYAATDAWIGLKLYKAMSEMSNSAARPPREKPQMKEFLAIFTGSPDSENMKRWQALSPHERTAREALGLREWISWGIKNQSQIVKQGGPLGKTKAVGPMGINDIRNCMSAFVIVRAENHEQAAHLFLQHPHFHIFPGDGVEIMECLPIPR